MEVFIEKARYFQKAYLKKTFCAELQSRLKKTDAKIFLPLENWQERTVKTWEKVEMFVCGKFFRTFKNWESSLSLMPKTKWTAPRMKVLIFKFFTTKSRKQKRVKVSKKPNYSLLQAKVWVCFEICWKNQ